MDANEGLNWLEGIFLMCALVGGVLFIFRLVVMVLGFDHHGDIDFHGDVDVSGDVDVHGDVHSDSDVGFKLLTFQGITAFLMMFGVVGLFLDMGLRINAIISIMGASGAGMGMTYLQARLMQAMLKLQSSGTLNVKNAIGAEGTVYLTIPANGVGKVQVSVQDRLVEFEAVTDDKSEIKTGEQIRVVFMKGDVLVVERA